MSKDPVSPPSWWPLHNYGEQVPGSVEGQAGIESYMKAQNVVKNKEALDSRRKKEADHG